MYCSYDRSLVSHCFKSINLRIGPKWTSQTIFISRIHTFINRTSKLPILGNPIRRNIENGNKKANLIKSNINQKQEEKTYLNLRQKQTFLQSDAKRKRENSFLMRKKEDKA